MKEWNNRYNVFNSMKILMWRDHLEACAKGHYLVPMMVDIDPSPKCNLKCPWCNAYNIIDNHRANLPEEHWLKLADFLSIWGKIEGQRGIRSACISGGGEPMMNTATPALVERLKANDIEVGVITNGTIFTERSMDLLAKNCRWIGISGDASTKETYNKIKGVSGDCFEKMCSNIERLASRGKELKVQNDICFKFLLSPDNYTEIYEAAKLAKGLGVHDFHLRPVGYLGIEPLKDKELIYTEKMLKEIDDAIEKSFELSDENFNFYGVRHKYSVDFQPKKNFSKCWCIPMLPTFGADGNVYYCFDIRGREGTIMCKHNPDVTEIMRFWNTQKHKDMVNNFDVNSCTKCTFAPYNEAVEQVILKDSMCRNFV